MVIEEKPKVRSRIFSVRKLVIFFAILLIAALLVVIIYFAVSNNTNEFGTLTCTISEQDIGFIDDRHYMLCKIEDQIVDAPNISIASTGEDRLVNDFSIWNQTNMLFLPDRIGQRFPNLFFLGSSHTKIRSLQRSNFVGFRRLRSLYITHSDLEDIEYGAFHPLNSLEVLDLSNNKLEQIFPQWFRNKLSLAFVSLNSNQIEHIPRGVFEELPSLRTLSLNNNKITNISSPHFPMFLHNNLIRQFNFMFNPVTFISDIAFDGNFQRLTVELYGSTCFQNRSSTLTIPPDDWKRIVREACRGWGNLSLE